MPKNRNKSQIVDNHNADIQELKRAQNIKALIGIYLQGNNTRAWEAREALIEIGEPAAEAIRSILLDQSIHSCERSGAAEMLAVICGSGAIESLASVLLNKNDDGFIRDCIPATLGDLGYEKAIASLSKVITDEEEDEMLRVFAGTALERIVPWEKIDPPVREVITEIGPTEFKSFVPATNIQDVEQMIEEGTYRYPLYAFLLYTEIDKDFSRFVDSKGRWLHDLSGEQCLISAFENPERWGEGWKNYWKEKIGSDEFDLKSMKWAELTPLDRNNAFRLAESLDLDKNLLPCIVFVDPDSSHEIMSVPVISDPAEYANFFKDIFTAVRRVSQARKGQKLRDLKKAWLKYLLKWSAQQNAKLLTGKIEKWGSVLKELDDKTTFISLLIKYSPLITMLATLALLMK